MPRKSRKLIVPEQPVIRFAPGIWEQLCASVGCLEPEHYAVLSGKLDDPFYVTGFHPMPPMLDERGRSLSSSTRVTLNAPFLEYLLNTSLLPFGKYFLGVVHSHPGRMTSLSSGMPGSGQGDIPSMRAHLEAAARLNVPWHNYLAPIVTEPGESLKVTGWVIRLDHDEPLPVEILFENEAPPIAPFADHRESDVSVAAVLNEALAELDTYQASINRILADRSAPELDKSVAVELVRRLRARDISRIEETALFNLGLGN